MKGAAIYMLYESYWKAVDKNAKTQHNLELRAALKKMSANADNSHTASPCSKAVEPLIGGCSAALPQKGVKQ
jgi:hypothetical protein